ncbi:AEC family transporter [Thiothrix subterranea]|uniref:AEC family transporter n=1 Tax=Thiothrix subterranea TaxID=2735563 RepID=A0AA51MJ27_9GAMM|nr:AEC family transporter [Thiothrix subterranea]MDQ5768095.1 AEC family transporter [Thiothrix subterranea]WML85143.1 AEC family transporter [Thiothrix subterranea]
MLEFWNTVLFSFAVTGPIFLLLGLGAWLARLRAVNDNFVEVGSRLVFTWALPALLFVSIAKTSISATTNLELIAYGLVAMLVLFVLTEWAVTALVQPPEDRGVVVQGIFRSNMAIIGLAYCVNAYGEVALAAASLYVGILSILFNILGVITLSRSLHKHQGVGRMLRNIVTNPLIIGIVLALPFAWWDVRPPALVMKAGETLADMTLPLALLCTGASLDFHTLKQEFSNTLLASLSKLVAIPFLFTLGGWWWGFRGMDLGILLLMSSAPTAAASYVMARAMGGNATLAANTVALTTLGSLLTTSVGIVLLQSRGLM